jgi:hypothetical protein
MLESRVELVTVTSINKDNWLEKKLKLIEKYPDLIKIELNYEEGKIEEMIDKIHAKIGETIGKTKDELHKFIEAL